jgi:hypothetical protein
MIQSHLSAIENSLISISKIQENSGHPLHKGTPREAFVKEFLTGHLGESVSFGTGEIIDSSSKPGEKRNQFDIVIYKKEFPKLDFHSGISAFVAESVIATIDVKSTITYEDFETAFKAAIKCKRMERNYFEGLTMWYKPPAIQNFIVAYNGPKKMKTVYDWIKKIERKLKIKYPEMPNNIDQRKNIPSPGIDGIFVLGKGFLHFDNFLINNFNPEIRKENEWAKWLFGNSKNYNLLLLFLNLTQTICTYSQRAINMLPYIKGTDETDIQNYSWGE